jgi:thiosulfate/3-mercaptopyruvate sulfurtransferase
VQRSCIWIASCRGEDGRNGRHPLPEVATLATTFGRAGIDASTQVVAYDQNNGAWASRLWWLLHWLGHDAAAVLDGGLDKWAAEGRPLTSETPKPRAAIFLPKQPAPTASAEDLLRHLDDGALLVLDARAAERYQGDVEPIDPIGGHIPGARNRPYTENLAPQGTFKPAERLRPEFEAALGGRSPSAVVHQCGSGVTACHNALAMAVAGLPGSRLYPGSWSEWIADPRRWRRAPIVRRERAESRPGAPPWRPPSAALRRPVGLRASRTPAASSLIEGFVASFLSR